MNLFGKNIDFLLDSKKFKQKELLEACPSLNQPKLWRIRNLPGYPVSVDVLEEVAQYTHLSPAILTSVDLKETSPAETPQPGNQGMEDSYAGGKFVSIRPLDLRGSNGSRLGGRRPFINLDVTEDWFRANVSTSASPASCRYDVMVDQTMHGKIEQGEIVLIDTTVNEVSEEGEFIYVFTFYGIHHIKYLVRPRAGELDLLYKGSNKNETSMSILPQQYEGLTVHGRVLASLGVKRF